MTIEKTVNADCLKPCGEANDEDHEKRPERIRALDKQETVAAERSQSEAYRYQHRARDPVANDA